MHSTIAALNEDYTLLHPAGGLIEIDDSDGDGEQQDDILFSDDDDDDE